MKPHSFRATPRHDFRGEDAKHMCGHLSADGDICVEDRRHALHRYVPDPEEVLIRRMLGARRNYRDITEGNPRLVDHGV